MTRLPCIFVAAAAALWVTGLQASAAAPPATIRVVSVPTSNRLFDVPPKGLSAGDVLRQRTTLSNSVAQFGKPKGTVVGYDETVAKLSSPTVASVDVAVHLPGGTLRVRGTVDITADSHTVRVVSGTGSFNGARGTASETDDAKSARAVNVYRLTYGHS